MRDPGDAAGQQETQRAEPLAAQHSWAAQPSCAASMSREASRAAAFKDDTAECTQFVV